MLRVDLEFACLWIAIKPEIGQILAQNITQEIYMRTAEIFLSDIIRIHKI